jgi:methionyl-tRNA formyltransferase
MVKPLRVVYMGTPQFAVPTLSALLTSRHVVCGVITQPDRPRGRGQQVSYSPVKQLALEHNLPVFQPERLREAAVEQTLRGWAPDLGVVAAYGRIIPESLLHLPPHGMINVHASLLPRWRGAAPVHRAVIAGDAKTGVTIMRVVKALDAGAMFAKTTRPIGADETSDIVERDLAERGASLLMLVVDAIAGSTAVEEPQDESLVTYAARLTKEEGLIDWTLPAGTIHNRVRGLYPWPHAYTFLDGRRLIILRTHPRTDAASEEPGTVLAVSSLGIEVAAGQGYLLIDQLQPEGRRPMAVHEFLAGHRVIPGSRFVAPVLSPHGDAHPL